MSAFQLLQNACGIRSFKSFSDLTVGKYIVTSFKIFKTQYGQRVAVLIGQTYYSLPNRFNEEITSQDQVNELNSRRYEMIYLGKDRLQKNRLMLEFMDISTEGCMEDDNEGIDIVG